jgi:hypothetical protein
MEMTNEEMDIVKNESKDLKNDRHSNRLYPTSVFDKAIIKEDENEVTYSRKKLVRIMLGHLPQNQNEIENYIEAEIAPLNKINII